LVSINNHITNANSGESGWGYYTTSGINLGYQGAGANMNLSEYIVFENENRDYLVNLLENQISYYNIKL
jgi:hypothetical protein